MKEIKYFLDPIPDTNQYLITKTEDGKITEVGVRTTESLIERWGKNHSSSNVIVQGLKDHYEIELYD